MYRWQKETNEFIWSINQLPTELRINISKRNKRGLQTWPNSRLRHYIHDQQKALRKEQ